MSTASSAGQSNAAHGIRDSAKDAAREAADAAREGVREFTRATASASGDIQKDLQALREDFGRLADEVADIVSRTGTTAWSRAKAHVDDAVAQAQDSGRETAESMQEAADRFIGVVDEQLKTRPYATLAIAAGLGFLFGLTWRR